jgi:hypothetical protein
MRRVASSKQVGFLIYCRVMDYALYQRYLKDFVSQARQASDGSVGSIAEELGTIQVGRWLVAHKLERKRALADARRAFDEHRHWPLEIILSHLGLLAD